MSQVTRCPACGTLFKVVPDQLRISQGWVRCGQCAEVFDASLELHEQMPGPAVPAELLSPEPMADAGIAEQAPPSAGEPIAPTLVDIAPQWPQNEPVEDLATDAAGVLAPPVPDDLAGAVGPAGDSDDETAPQVAEPESVPERLFVAIAPEAAAQDGAKGLAAPMGAMPLPQRPATERAPLAADAVVPVRPPGAPVAAAAHAELSFLRDAPAPVLPLGRAAPTPARWLAAAAVLALLLVLQWLVHERDRVAVAAPALRPVVQALCAPLRCSVQPLRRIDAVVIDGSAFVALGQDGYRLSLTLRNRASHAVALPAVELSLTDIQEQAVVRRVLLSGEIGSPPSELAAHGEWATSVDLQVADSASRARVVGYRLDVFYP